MDWPGHADRGVHGGGRSRRLLGGATRKSPRRAAPNRGGNGDAARRLRSAAACLSRGRREPAQRATAVEVSGGRRVESSRRHAAAPPPKRRPSRLRSKCAASATWSARCATTTPASRLLTSTISIARCPAGKCGKSASPCARLPVAHAAHNRSVSTWPRTSLPRIRPALTAPAWNKRAAEQFERRR